jgi:hypothetical protein
MRSATFAYSNILIIGASLLICLLSGNFAWGASYEFRDQRISAPTAVNPNSASDNSQYTRAFGTFGLQTGPVNNTPATNLHSSGNAQQESGYVEGSVKDEPADSSDSESEKTKKDVMPSISIDQ